MPPLTSLTARYELLKATAKEHRFRLTAAFASHLVQYGPEDAAHLCDALVRAAAWAELTDQRLTVELVNATALPRAAERHQPAGLSMFTIEDDEDEDEDVFDLPDEPCPRTCRGECLLWQPPRRGSTLHVS